MAEDFKEYLNPVPILNKKTKKSKKSKGANLLRPSGSVPPASEKAVPLESLLIHALESGTSHLLLVFQALVLGCVQLIVLPDDIVTQRIIVATYTEFISSKDFLTTLIDGFNKCTSWNVRGRYILLILYWLETRFQADFINPNTKLGNNTFRLLTRFIKHLKEKGYLLDHFEVSTRLQLQCVSQWQRMRMGRREPNLQRTLDSTQKQEDLSQIFLLPPNEKEARKEANKFHTWVFWQDSLEIAERFTVIEWEMFRRIQDYELMNLNWKNPNTVPSSANVLEMIARSNNVASWIATTILQTKDLSSRVQLIDRFVDIGEACLKINNLNTTMAIIGGLNMTPVQRLRRTWEKVSSRTKEGLQKLEETMSSHGNYRRYRQLLDASRAANKFALPYLGVYLRDLVFIEEGVDTRIDRQVNLEKVELMRNLLYELHFFQNKSFSSPFARTIKNDDEAQQYFLHVSGLPEEVLTKLSYSLEPSRAKAKPPGVPSDSISSSHPLSVDSTVGYPRSAEDTSSSQSREKTPTQDSSSAH